MKNSVNNNQNYNFNKTKFDLKNREDIEDSLIFEKNKISLKSIERTEIQDSEKFWGINNNIQDKEYYLWKSILYMSDIRFPKGFMEIESYKANGIIDWWNKVIKKSEDKGVDDNLDNYDSIFDKTDGSNVKSINITKSISSNDKLSSLENPNIFIVKSSSAIKSSTLEKKSNSEIKSNSSTKSEGLTEENPIAKKVLNNKFVSKSGNVVGIDVSQNVTPQQLRDILTTANAIGNSTKSCVGKPDTKTSDLAGKINYVYIKIGASGSESGKLYPSTVYKEQAKVCEELGIPYGFYFYSTSINEKEAKQEGEYILNAINELDVNKTRYNILPVAIDVELESGTQDRQYGKDVSKVKAKLANIVSKKYGPTVLYSGERMLNGAEKILDYDTYISQLETESLGIWLASPRLPDGTYNKDTKDYINRLKNDTLVRQDLLDVELQGNKEKIAVDVNIMDEKTYDKLIKGNYKELESNSKNSGKTNNKKNTISRDDDDGR